MGAFPVVVRGKHLLSSPPSMSTVTPISILPDSVGGGSKRSAVSSNSETSMSTTPTASANSRSVSPQQPPSKSKLKLKSNRNPIQALHPRNPQIQERGKLDIWMLGITIVIGGQYFSWNEGVSAGFGSFLVAYVVVAFAYIALCCCTAEITGALPFAGGAYGLARCTLGFFPGFLIGCCEALEYIAYVSTTTLFLADLLKESIPALVGYEPLIWLIFYISALAIQLKSGRVFWYFNLAIGAVSLLIVLLFIFGSLPHVNFAKNASLDPTIGLVGGVSGFLRVLPLATWFFVGVEALSMASDDVVNPKQVVPKAQVYCVLTLAVTGIVVYSVCGSIPHGKDGQGLAGFAKVLAPLDVGFELMFDISTTTATLLSLPATYATAFGFIWCYGKLISAMATSRLLPPLLARTSEGENVPYMALLVGSALSYGLCVLVHFVPVISKYLFSICITSAFVAYAGQCVGYISLKINYRNIKNSSFTNPFGIAGAIFSLSVWIVGLVSIAGFQENGGIEIQAFLGIVVFLVVVYYGYAQKRQTFSPQENKVLLVAHVIKFNAATRERGKKVKTKSKTRHNNSTNHHSSHGGGGPVVGDSVPGSQRSERGIGNEWWDAP